MGDDTCKRKRLSATPLSMMLVQDLLVDRFCTRDQMPAKQPTLILVLNLLEILFVELIAHVALENHRKFFANVVLVQLIN